jgi:hypothetical protein
VLYIIKLSYLVGDIIKNKPKGTLLDCIIQNKIENVGLSPTKELFSRNRGTNTLAVQVECY